jgi:hypothetical protein
LSQLDADDLAALSELSSAELAPPPSNEQESILRNLFSDKKFSDKKFSDKKFLDKKFLDKKFLDKKFSVKKFSDKKFKFRPNDFH